jgi:polysaccharide biosynthesis transport protein
MNAPERPEGALAPWSPSPIAAKPSAPAWDELAGEGNAPRMFNPKVVARALKRHWWRILAVWAIGSAGLGYLAYTKIRPSFEATAWLEVEPPAREILVQSRNGADFGPYLDTQVLLITSPEVLAKAIYDEDIASLPKVKSSIDPEVDLRKEIAVAVQKGTHVIKVQMTGENPGEVAAIVNAVVKAYLEKAASWTDEASRENIAKLDVMMRDQSKLVDSLKSRVRELSKKAGDAPAPLAGKGEDAKESGLKYQVTMEEYRHLNTELSRLHIERYKAEVAVKYFEDELNRFRGGVVAPVTSGPMSEAQVYKAVDDEFKSHPEALSRGRALDDAVRKFDESKRRIKNIYDPTRRRAERDAQEAERAYTELWETMFPILSRKVQTAHGSNGAAPDSASMQREQNLSMAKLELKKIKLNEEMLDRQIKDASVEVSKANNEIWDVQYAKDELVLQQDTLTTITKHKEELVYEAGQGARIKLIAKANRAKSATGDNRMKALIAAPVVMLILSCLMFIALEFKSGRVADPDELSQRVRVGVIGVVPPLPSLNAPTRALSARGIQAEKRKVEEFVQSLDHLRVTLCAPRGGQSDRRCILITSATGGEGKTTLAAQLAGRCANAGLMTLLIDADLRRPSLGDLLEVPEGPGFVDVLTGDATPEAAMVVIGNAGGFHLLPAGTLGQDPSRLFHGDRLGRVITQFRETFDIVIIDAPPVLAVPDALLLGRWTDGAILAVRHDTSRFPLVERANKRMASVGVAVLGAVVNGCPSPDSAYGSYRYTPYAAAEAPGGAGGVGDEV